MIKFFTQPALHFSAILLLMLLLLPDFVFAQVPPATITFPTDKNVVEIPFTRYRSWIIIKAEVNNKKTLSFILDTGAPIAVLADKDISESLALNIVGQARVSGGDGKEPKTVPLASGAAFKIGDLEIGNCMIAVGAATEVIAGVDGVIGKYVFENSVVEINWKENKLIITKPESFEYKGSGEVIPFEMASSGHIFTNVIIEKNGKQKTIKSTIDTGNRSTFKMNNLENFYEDKDALKNIITGWGANGSELGDVTRVNISFGNIQFSDVVASSSQNPNGRLENEGITGNIGLSILERFNIILDYKHNVMILEKNEAFSNDFTFNKSGIILHPKRAENYLVIAEVIPGSPASEKGLQKEDKILTINGKSVQQYSMDEIDSLITGKNIKEIKIELKRNEELLYKTIIMKKLI